MAAAIQMPSEPLNVAGTLRRADRFLCQAGDRWAELVVLPEMFNAGYGFLEDVGPVAEGPDGPTLSHLRRRSRRWEMGIVAGFVERDGRHLYDSLAFATPEGDLHVYRKQHL